MKTPILKSTIAVLLAATLPLARAQEKKETPGNPQPSDAGASAPAKTDPGGHVAGLLQAGRKMLGKLEKVTWLGVAAEPVSDEVRAQLPLQSGEGLTVRHLMPESPAAQAGLQEHDILMRFDDQILVSSEQLRSLVKMRKPGDTVKLAYLRKGEKKEATATLAEHQVEVTRDDVIDWLKNPENRGAALEQGRERIKEMEQRFQELKGRLPGTIIEKRSFLIGPDGSIRKLTGQKMEELVDELRKKLDQADITPEEREQVRKSLEDALRAAREAVEKVEDLVKKNGEKKAEEKQP